VYSQAIIDIADDIEEVLINPVTILMANEVYLIVSARDEGPQLI